MARKKPSSSPGEPRHYGRKTQFVRPEIRCKEGRKGGVYWDGKFWYLGPWNGKDPIPTPMYRAWLRLCEHLEQVWLSRQAELPEPDPEKALAIVEAVDQWLFQLEHNPRPLGDLKADGTLADHFHKAVYRLKPLVALYGDVPAAEFTAKMLQEFMRRLAAGNWWTPHNNPYKNRTKAPKPFAPSYINKVRADVVRMYKWLELEDFVPKGHAEHLRNMPPYDVAPTPEEACQLVTAEDLEATCQHASPVVATMIRLQYATAARPSEICIMKEQYFDKRHVQGVWLYRPPTHKTAYLGKVRVIPLNRQCQELLKPFLDRPVDEFLFKPEESHKWWQEERARNAGHTRKTSVTPSELKQRAKRKRQRKHAPKQRPFAPRFTAYTYAQAVRRAIQKAREANKEVADWTPYALRHTTLTDVQWKAGEEASAALGGHSRNVNRRYAHKQTLRAIRVATKLVKGNLITVRSEPRETPADARKDPPSQPRRRESR